MRTRLRRAAAAVAVAGLALTGCGLGTAGGPVPDAELAGPLAEAGDLDGAEISVGSKNFTESILLGKIALIVMKAAGAEVTDLTNIPGSAATRQAALEGQIDAQWEYTGTGWITYLGHTDPIKDETEQYEAVRDEDLENGLAWLPPAPMNNTYGFAVTKQTQEKYGLKTLSDIAKVPVGERTLCIESEFANRPDGLNGMLETYGLSRGADGVPEDNLQTYQTGAIYDATAKGRCTFGEVFTTDGRILALDLVVLEDDKRYFPNYNVSLVLGEQVLDDHPDLADLFAPVSEKLTNEVLLELNARIDVDGEDPTDVARDWLAEEGLVDPA
jgi:osmoprotectant transport system substrate-binding protein